MKRVIKTTEEKLVNAMKKVFITGLVIGIGTGIGLTIAIPKLHASYVANHHYGHYEAEYQDSNGRLYDIDGDGDYYKWVYDCTPYCNGNHEEER